MPSATFHDDCGGLVVGVVVGGGGVAVAAAVAAGTISEIDFMM